MRRKSRSDYEGLRAPPSHRSFERLRRPHCAPIRRDESLPREVVRHDSSVGSFRQKPYPAGTVERMLWTSEIPEDAALTADGDEVNR